MIQSDNWLAGGMFAVGYEKSEEEGGHPQIDYGYYYMLTLDHDCSLYLDFGINQTYECIYNPLNRFPNGTLPWTRGLFNATVSIEGVSHSTPITLTASWDTPHLGWVSWDYTVGGITYPAGAVNVTELAPTIQHVFYVGSRNLEDLTLIANPSLDWIPYWQTYCFQSGVISLHNIGHGGWNVLLSDPSYFKDGQWHNVETALSIGGVHAMLDYRWMWRGQNYEGVEAINYPYPNNVKFYYSGSTLEDLTPLWVPETPHVIGIPLAPADSSETHTYFSPPIPDYAYAEVDTNRTEYRLEVGSSLLNGSDSYANATLFKNFSPSHTVTNPTFYFRFHDKGYMDAPYGNTILNAFLRLWHNDNELFRYNPLIHIAIGSSYSTDCFHKIGWQYCGELLANNTYTIEYGFAAFEHEAYADFHADEYQRKIKASWLVYTDNYKLSVFAEDQYSTSLTTGDVYIDDELAG